MGLDDFAPPDGAFYIYADCAATGLSGTRFALELHLEKIAHDLGLDPVAMAFQPALLACLASSALSVSNLTNLIAVDIACDKELTKAMLHDVGIPVPRGEVVTYGELAALAGRPGAARAAGIVGARDRAKRRLQHTPWSRNAEVSGSHLRRNFADLPGAERLKLALTRGAISMRGFDKCLRLAWTLADLGERTRPSSDDFAKAIWLRGVEPTFGR